MEVVLLNLIPFAMALLFCLSPVRQFLKSTGMAFVTAGAMALLFIGFSSFLPQVTQGETITKVIEWVPSLNLTLNWYVDSLSLMMTLIVTGVGIAVFFYAGFYMEDPDELGRFYVYLLAFSGAMLSLVMAGNVFMLFIAWEGTSILSFMLIGFKGYKDEEARVAASRALVITGGGGLALFAGLMLLGVATNTLHGLAPFAEAGFQFDLILASNLTSHEWYVPILILVLLGAFTKSAQFPFHFWLPGGMTAPSPASAYLHSATMVKAGIYLLFRLQPSLGGDWLWVNSLLVVGLTTMLLGSFFALRKRDLKGLLAYSTISKLGAIVALIGLPNGYGLKGAAISIVAHALYKATFFLMAGIIEHATGTRDLDKLGGLAKKMPLALGISAFVALSMAGVPPFIGFAAKEFLLDEFLRAPYISALPVIIAFIASLFTAIASLYYVWDAFMAERQEDYKHFHAPPPMIYAGPALLAFMSLFAGIFITPLLTDLTIGVIGKETEVYIIPHDLNPLTNSAFGLSLLVLIGAGILFAYRQVWIQSAQIIVPTGQAIYAKVIRSWEWIGDFALRSQTGNIRHYLLVILISVSLLMFYGSTEYKILNVNITPKSSVDLLRMVLLVLTMGSTLAAIVLRRHLLATLALGVTGYMIGGLFLLEPGPDVALVQILVETLTAVLLILIVARIDVLQRVFVINNLWQKDNDNGRFSLLIDAGVAFLIGMHVMVFALAAVNDRDSRLNELRVIQEASVAHIENERTHMEEQVHINITRPIVLWHMENAYPQAGVPDVIAALLADFRGTDTLLEITVFATAALGVMTILVRPRDKKRMLAGEPTIISASVIEDNLEIEDLFDPESHREDDTLYNQWDDRHSANEFSTPLTRFSAKLILPIALLISFTHVLYGGSQPGDGFTAGVVSGLVVALWFIVFGYNHARSRLGWLRPVRLIITGLIIAVITGLLGLIVKGSFFAGIDLGGSFANLHLSTALLFEFAIFLTVFGGVTTIMTAIAHPEALIEDQES